MGDLDLIYFRTKIKVISKNNIFFQGHWGFFIGKFTDNQMHKHYAVQWSISLKSEIQIMNGWGTETGYQSVRIKSNVLHALKCEKEQLTLLFYPTATIGHYLNNMGELDLDELEHHTTQSLKQSALYYVNGEMDFKSLVEAVSKEMDRLGCSCALENHFSDTRIQKAISYLESNYERVIPVTEIANICGLSSSRFLHLFKEKTGLTYRKVQQWNKVSRSFLSLREQSITQTAYEFGFTDSAHYTKTFKETFGFSPKQLKSS